VGIPQTLTPVFCMFCKMKMALNTDNVMTKYR
jgi:hypothetical protein